MVAPEPAAGVDPRRAALTAALSPGPTSPVSVLKRGDVVAERYSIVEQIGAGGMGVVYEARDDRLRRTVAVKVLSPERVGNKTARARLIREARAAAAFADPGIAQVFDVGDTEDGGAFLVMELVRGAPVRTMLPLHDQAEALRIVAEVARTLDAAHKADLVHRDVKPDNIMIREDGRVMLLDFGLAKETAPERRPKSTEDSEDSVVTAQGTMLGTPPYVAPEQIHGKGVGPASDQFALAVVAFGLLTGKKPWDAMNDLGMLGQILTEPPRAATSLKPSLPAAVDPVFQRALARDASQRFPSVQAFADALETAVTGAPVVRPAADAPREMSRPSMRPPAASHASLERAPHEKTPAPQEKSNSADGLRLELDLPPSPSGSIPPPAYQSPAFKVRVDNDDGGGGRDTRRSPVLLIAAALVIAILAAAVGVWYGRQGAPPPGANPSGASP